jgi:predicted glycosyltransferase
MIAGYTTNCSIIPYDRKTFIVQATDGQNQQLIQLNGTDLHECGRKCDTWV